MRKLNIIGHISVNILELIFLRMTGSVLVTEPVILRKRYSKIAHQVFRRTFMPNVSAVQRY